MIKMDKNIKIGIGLVLILIVGAFFVVGYSPFAAVPSSHGLGTFEKDNQISLDGTVHLDSDSKNMDLYYRYEVYGPHADTTCYNSPIFESDWMHYGDLNAGSTANLNAFDILPDTSGNYVVYLLVKDDGGDPYQTPIGNTAGDNSYKNACLSNPSAYGCPSACKDTCCSGVGYKFTVEEPASTEYIGTATLTANQWYKWNKKWIWCGLEQEFWFW